MAVPILPILAKVAIDVSSPPPPRCILCQSKIAITGLIPDQIRWKVDVTLPIVPKRKSTVFGIDHKPNVAVRADEPAMSLVPANALSVARRTFDEVVITIPIDGPLAGPVVVPWSIIEWSFDVVEADQRTVFSFATKPANFEDTNPATGYES